MRTNHPEDFENKQNAAEVMRLQKAEELEKEWKKQELEEQLEEQSEKIKRLQEELSELRRDKAIVEWLGLQVVEVRKPMRYGSHQLFLAAPNQDEEEGDSPSDFREQCLKAMNQKG